MERPLDDRNAPASKGDILDIGTRIDSLETRIDSLETRMDEKVEQLRTEVNHGYRDLVERMDDGFTKLLNAFYGVAETHGKRLGELDSNEHAIRSRLSTVENRVMEIEKRLNTPPTA
jgi:chaperonin cofactor prefoldin